MPLWGKLLDIAGTSGPADVTVLFSAKQQNSVAIGLLANGLPPVFSANNLDKQVWYLSPARKRSGASILPANNQATRVSAPALLLLRGTTKALDRLQHLREPVPRQVWCQTCLVVLWDEARYQIVCWQNICLLAEFQPGVKTVN